jgi:predicted permease
MYILLRMLLLPGTMALICVLFGLRDVRGMALVVLACAPVAQLAFVLTQQYDAGAEVVTGVIILGIVVMLPHIIGVLQLAKATGLFSFELQATAS